jgi:anaphase-promoting complex subunit 2
MWTLDELSSRVGSVDRTAALKALITWVDLGVLKEDIENNFRLLERAEEPTGTRAASSRLGQ